MANYYQILGVSRMASQYEVRRAYREKAKCIHPDINPGTNAHNEFQMLNEAYQVLINANKRRIYDLRLKKGVPSQKVYYRPSGYYTSYKEKGAKYAQRSTKESEDPGMVKFEKYFDLFLFLTLTFVGIFSFLYGMYRLFLRPHEEISPYPGIILGVFFTSLMVFIWSKKVKMLDN